MSPSKKRITGRSMLLDVMRQYPQTRKVFSRHGMNCRGCMGAAAETIAASAVSHGLDPEAFVRELNEAVAQGSKEEP